MSCSIRLCAFCFLTGISMIVGVIIAESGEPAKTGSSDVRSRYMRAVPGDYLWLLSNEEAIIEQGGPFANLLRQVRGSKVPTQKEAERQAFAHALSGTETALAFGLVRSGVDIPGFASRGDLIWIVRVGERRPHTEVWISSSTAEERWLLTSRRGMPLQPTLQEAWQQSSQVPTLLGPALPPKLAAPAASQQSPLSVARPPRPAVTLSPSEEKQLAERWADARGRAVAFDLFCLLNEENASLRATWAAKIADDASLPESRRNRSLQSTDGAMLDRLARSKLPTAEKAEEYAARLRDEGASGSGFQSAGIAVSGVPRVVGLVHSPGDSAGFASKGDPVWVVHFLNGGDLLGEVTQACWINAMTGEARWIFPLDMPTSSAPAQEEKP